MRGLARWIVSTLMLTGFLVAISVSTAGAAGGGCPAGQVPSPRPGGGGVICIPATSGPTNPETPTGPSGPQVCTTKGASGADITIPCADSDFGNWSQAQQCYLRLVDPQPPATDPVWTSMATGEDIGRSPETGRIFYCTHGYPGFWGTYELYVEGGGTPNPATLAQQALDDLPLAVPQIGVAPAPPAKTYVGLDTWLWVPEAQWATLTKSVTAGATTVTVTAAPRRIVWDMGPETKSCGSPGREWKVGRMDPGSETSCSYTYRNVSDFEPDGAFDVTATIVYDVDWTCTGDCLAPNGTLGEVDSLPSTSQLVVGERQSVNITPPKEKR